MLSSAVSILPVYSAVGELRTSDTVGEAVAAKPRPDTDRLQAFHTAIKSTESTEGVYGTGMAEQLMGLGLALQRESRHADAIRVFKRGFQTWLTPGTHQ